MDTNISKDYMQASKVPKRTRRLRLRLRDYELSKLAAAAAQRGQYLAEFVREASLATAQAMTASAREPGES